MTAVEKASARFRVDPALRRAADDVVAGSWLRVRTADNGEHFAFAMHFFTGMAWLTARNDHVSVTHPVPELRVVEILAVVPPAAFPHSPQATAGPGPYRPPPTRTAS